MNGIDPRHDEHTGQRFSKPRACGWAAAHLLAELHVSKSTIIVWSRKPQFQIQNLKPIELEALSDQWLTSIIACVNPLGTQPRKIADELARRAAAALRTTRSFALVHSACAARLSRPSVRCSSPPLRRRFQSANTTTKSKTGKDSELTN